MHFPGPVKYRFIALMSVHFVTVLLPSFAARCNTPERNFLLVRYSIFMHQEPFGVYYYYLKWFSDVGDNQRSTNNVVHFLMAKREKKWNRRRKNPNTADEKPTNIVNKFCSGFYRFVNISILLPLKMELKERRLPIAHTHC